MQDTKRQELPGGLWIVATPIGNLGDLSPRAVQALTEADALLCEDTRRTGILLAAFKIAGGKLKRFDAHSSQKQIDQVIEWLKEGKNLALVTDAGTPAVSDPGALLIAEARKNGVRITPFPGPSAVTALLSVSGFHETEFSFRGFFPRKLSEQKKEFKMIRDTSLSSIFIWFESPQRIVETLQFITNEMPDADLVAGKEMTKLHEKFFSGTAVEVFKQVREEIELRGPLGEWCFVVKIPKAARVQDKEKVSESSDWVKALHCLIDLHISASDAAKTISQQFGTAKKEVYEMALRLSGKKNS